MEAVRNNPDIDVKENHFAVEIITQHHLGARVTRRTPYINCYGAYVLNPDTQKVDTYLSKVTVMCTGGCGAVYLTTYCHGVSRQGNGGRHGVRAVPSHGAA